MGKKDMTLYFQKVGENANAYCFGAEDLVSEVKEAILMRLFMQNPEAKKKWLNKEERSKITLMKDSENIGADETKSLSAVGVGNGDLLTYTIDKKLVGHSSREMKSEA